jgi:hypothetical protein
MRFHEAPTRIPQIPGPQRFLWKKTNRIVSFCLEVNAVFATMIIDHACTVPRACHKLIVSGNASNRFSCFCSHYHHVFHNWILVRVDYSCPELAVERAYRSGLFNHQCAIVLEQLLQASWCLIFERFVPFDLKSKKACPLMTFSPLVYESSTSAMLEFSEITKQHKCWLYYWQVKDITCKVVNSCEQCITTQTIRILIPAK